MFLVHLRTNERNLSVRLLQYIHSLKDTDQTNLFSVEFFKRLKYKQHNSLGQKLPLYSSRRRDVNWGLTGNQSLLIDFKTTNTEGHPRLSLHGAVSLLPLLPAAATQPQLTTPCKSTECKAGRERSACARPKPLDRYPGPVLSV